MAEPTSSTSSAMLTGRSSMSMSSTAVPTSSSSNSSSSKVAMVRTRRDLAHAPHLLGVGEDGLIQLHGLGISSSAESERFRSGLSNSSSAKSQRPPTEERREFEESEDERFRIEEEEEEEEEDDDETETLAGQSQVGHHLAEQLQSQSSEMQTTIQSGDRERKSATLLAPIRIESYALEGYQVEQEGSAMIDRRHSQDRSGDDNIDLERQNDSAKYGNPNMYEDAGGEEEEIDEDGLENTARLYFEPITVREKMWICISVGLVAFLTIVSILISVNAIY